MWQDVGVFLGLNYEAVVRGSHDVFIFDLTNKNAVFR
jgi:hypothetical protein